VNGLSHISDIWRADILLKYGGIYMDTDAIFVRPLSKELRAYDVVLSYSFTGEYSPFPDIINCGIAVSKPGAQFWKLQLVCYILGAVWLITNLALAYSYITLQQPLYELTCFHLKSICILSFTFPLPIR